MNITINGLPYEVEEGLTILEAAHSVGVKIPTLCWLKEINEIGACRICLVEANGRLVASCVIKAEEGMNIVTNSERVFRARKNNLELLLSVHDKKCLSCEKSGKCEFQKLCNEMGVEESHYEGYRREYPIDDSAPYLIRDNNKCVLCRRCVAVCQATQGIGAIGPINRGFATYINTAFDRDLADISCVGCGQCVRVCPTGALMEKDSTADVWAALAQKDKHVVVQTAPAVRAALGEEFGLPIGTDVEGKMVAALRRLGFAKVFFTDFAADLTIMEEATELIERVQNGGALPMITSCSPGWIKYCEHFYPEMIPHLSSCKSPQQMFGAVLKTYYAEKNNIDPKDIISISVMPCTAKKFEIGRPDESASGYADVDYSITTKELARMIRKAGLDFAALPDEKFDHPLGESTGAGVIFGATGGVMEAALRTAVETLTGKELPKLEFEEVRGTKGIKEASYKVGELEVSVCVASGLANAKKVMEAVKNGEKNYTFIEIMACPGGCVNGGGQPTQPSEVYNFNDLRALRAQALYKNDAAKAIRKSHENPEIQKLYAEYFEKPGSHKAHAALHTTYVKRDRF